MDDARHLAADRPAVSCAAPGGAARPAPAPAGSTRWQRRRSASPIKQRALADFQGQPARLLSSLRLFLGIFVVSLCAELIANDKPILARYKGELLMPVLVDYPESKFGGFLAVTDYKDPVIKDEIEANGWMLWPPIRYSYSSINKDYPRLKGAEGRCLGFPAPPPWATRAALLRGAARPAGALPGDRQPQLARHRRPGPRRRRARHLRLRLSVLFGLILTILVGDDRHHGRRRAGLFRRQGRSRLPALPGDLVVDPVALRADHHLVGAGAGVLDAARRAAAVPVDDAGRRGAGGVPARAQLRVHHGGARARACPTGRSCSSTCCRTRWWRR